MKVSSLILSVCLVLLAQQGVKGAGHTRKGKLGDVMFECKEGWEFYNGNCFKAIDVMMKLSDASLTCSGQGGYLYYPENEIEYHTFVAHMLPKTIWFGLYKDPADDKWKIRGGENSLDTIPRWGTNQPDVTLGNATAVDPMKEVMIYDENKSLPFVCKHRACKEGYIPCDLATKCIPPSQICSEFPECIDKADQKNCPALGTHYLYLEEESGQFQTGSFADFDEQIWFLEAPVGKHIRLYVPRMALPMNCMFIEFWGGSPTLEYSELLHSSTGDSDSVYVFSKYHYLTVRMYTTDISTNIQRYTLGWTTIIPEIPDGVKVETAINSWKSFSLPFSDADVKPKDLMLWWRIDAPMGQLITYYLRLEPDTGYTTDDIKYDIKVDDMSALQYRYFYTSSRNEVYLQSMHVPENGAVTVRYKLGCGMDVDASYGVIVSPHPIPNNLMCSWTLNNGMTVSRGMVIKFFTLDLMEDTRTAPGTASKEMFMIYPNTSETGAITDVKLYEDNVDNVIHSSDGYFKIDFESDSAFMSEGFTIGFGTDCENLGVSDDTIKSTEMTYFQENVDLSCPTGYKFHMNKYRNQDTVTLRCDSMWEIDGEDPGAIPECQVVYCGPPTKIENGGVESSTGLTYGEIATYFCNEGLQKSNATCDENGDWIDVPVCESPQCTALNQNMLTNGMFEIIRGNEFTINGADFDTVVEFSCGAGYELVGPKISRCDIDGWTHVNNDPPSCKRLECAMPPIANSEEPDGFTAMSGETYTLICSTGYSLDSGNSEITLNCQDNGTFDQTPTCNDIDECTLNTDTCDDASTMCMNTIGSFICICNPGYGPLNQNSCTDIKECDDGENGGCSTRCVEEIGSYSCECDAGFELYEGNGFNGFLLPTGETGLRRGDMYHVNHTCVPVQCPDLSPVENGKYLTSLFNFHYQDMITLQCNDGYIVDTTGNEVTSTVSNCQSDGTWDQLYSCKARQCEVPVTPTYGAYDKTEVMFGESLKLTCTMTETMVKELEAVCIYDNDNVRFAGDDITQCPQIDCGDPNDVIPAGGTFNTPITTTHLPATSTFTFGCSAGFTVIGSSGDDDGDMVVKCKENGRWNLGTLTCAGNMCTDPGTPGDSDQIVNGYEVGSVLSYSCKRSGFTMTGPVNYTCENGVSTAAWSNNLAGSLPECKDTEYPTVSSVSCGVTYDIDAVDMVSFNSPTHDDNFALKSYSFSNAIRSGDRLIADNSVTYTVADFEDNDATCTVSFNVIDRSVKPTLACPDSKTVMVSSRNSDAYLPSSDVTASVDNLQVNPNSIAVNVNKIGTAEIVTATATDQYGTESSCTFMVNFEAGACFEEEIFADSNAIREFYDDASIVQSTCRSGYMFSDKTTSKNFTCSGTGTWDYNVNNILPHDRYCLLTQNPEVEVTIDIVHTYGYAFTSACAQLYGSKLQNDINNQVFRNAIQNLCGQQWDVTLDSSNAAQGFSLFEAKFNLRLRSSVSLADSNECIEKIKNDNSSVFEVSGKQMTCQSTSYSLEVEPADTVAGTPAPNCPVTGYYLDAEICLTHGPAQYLNQVSDTEASCPEGQYQDGLAQTSCKTCPSGQYPNSDQTGCQATCPRGFRSNDGFYPCEPCAVDTYWTAKDTCTPCTSPKTTVGIEGATDDTKCYDPCPVGTYSRTGYDVNGCTSCPVNFYQDETNQVTCKECDSDQMTATTRSISSNNCTAITDDCNAAYCNGNGVCSFKYHRRVCTCATGYNGDNCQNMYHICDGNPCTNSATCVRGDTPSDYSCTCRTDLDECQMTVVDEAKIGPQSDPTPSTTLSASNLQTCENACLNDGNCKDASYLVGACVLYNVELQVGQLQDETSAAQKHLRKSCITAFGGDHCELDTKDDCENAGCSENSRCVDKINGFECICRTGFSGTLCDVADNPCVPDPCDHGTCQAFGSVRYECTCQPGYEGLLCDQDIDECSLNPDACPYDGTCNNLVNRYSCSCKTGFSGPNCENTPNFCASHDCSGDNICYNSLDRMEGACECDTTLFDPLYRCAMDIVPNESATNQQGNLVGTNSGFTFEQCSDACQINPDCKYATYSESNGVCAQYNNSYAGQQDATSTAIYKNCNNIPEEAFACDQVKLPCESRNCNNGTCTNVANNLRSNCICDAGFTGSNCQHSIDDCVGNQCQNDAECVDGHLDYSCTCKVGFEGNRCQTNIDDCPGSCNTTYGSCEDGVDGYECICNAGYYGPDCTINFNECLSNPCEHDGTCTDAVNGYSCECPEGWEGNSCERRKNNCFGVRNCLNGGECFSLEQTSFCRCQGGAVGENCENATLLCDTLSNVDVCIHGGTCVNGDGTATCSCPVVYDVQRCYMDEVGLADKSGGQFASKIPPSQGSSITAEFCKNGCLNNKDCYSVSFVDTPSINFCVYYAVGEETLTDSPGSVLFRRHCPTDYEGVSCELVKDWCSENPCKNDGDCKPLGPVGYMCDCMPGYSGPTCEKEADPCDSNPCRGRATCMSTPTEYICQCNGGKIWTGTSCKTSRKDYTLVVDSTRGQPSPSLQTSFRLETNEFSILMRVRVHYVNPDSMSAALFRLHLSNDLEPSLTSDNEMTLTVSYNGIYVNVSGSVSVLTFTEEFGRNLFDGKSWHYLGIAIDSNGELSANVDALHVEGTTSIDGYSNVNYNAQIFLSNDYFAEFEYVEVYDQFLNEEDLSKVVGGEKPSFSPVQGFENYHLPRASYWISEPLSMNIWENPNLASPPMNCDTVTDIYYASSERLTSRDSITDLTSIYSAVEASGPDRAFTHTVESTLSWGYTPAIIIGEDPNTKNYLECRLNLYIRYNAECPAIDGLLDDSLSSRSCAGVGGYCDIKCSSDQQVLSAPLPLNMPCGSLGVFDYRMPFLEVYSAQCEAPASVSYRLDASMQFEFFINCETVPETTRNKIDDQIKANFIEDIRPNWNGICSDDGCTNVMDVEHECDSVETKRVNVKFSLELSSTTLEAQGGGFVDIEEILKIIIRIEKLIDLSTISGAQLIEDSVDINKVTICPDGNRLDMTREPPVCVPCSTGFFLMNGECEPCDFGQYQDVLAQTECKPCPDDKVTYRKGVSDPAECKEKCMAGYYYDSDEDDCLPCKRHFYQHEEGKNFCIPCDNADKTVSNASDSESDCKEDCPPGEERNKTTGICNMCRRGYWRSLTFDDCQMCPEGTTTFLDEHAETEADCKIDICALGEYFSVSEDMCKPCEPGFYQDEMFALECKPCRGNLTTREMGADNSSKCEFYCAPGYERNGSFEHCIPCERGFYKDNDGETKYGMCKTCGQSTTNMMAAISQDNCSIPICNEGQFIENGGCEPCPLDHYSDVELPYEETTCISCGTLRGTQNTGSTSDQCMRYCEPGKFLNGNNCDLCERGYFKNNIGSSRFENCTKCPDSNGEETTTDELGSDSSEACSVYKCTAGYFSSTTSCSECAMNTYQTIDHPLSTELCLPCQPKFGLTTNTMMTGSTSSADCKPICVEGRYLVDTACFPCQRGQFRPNVGNDRFGECIDCADDKTTEGVGARNSSFCTIPKCPAGQYLDNSVCTECGEGSYSEVLYPNSEVQCIPCGTRNDIVYGTEDAGADNSSLCKPTCPGGKQYDAETDKCTDCPIGSFKGEDDPFGTCISCGTVKPGFVTSIVGALTQDQCNLRDCPAGERIDGISCVTCPIGTYQDEARKTTCKECGENLSTDGDGKTSLDDCQIECGPGLVGSESCTLCPAGKFKPEAGYANCQDCPVDTTSNAERTACNLVYCSPGKEYLVVGSTESCEECDVGFYKNVQGNIMQCTQCDAGTTTNGTGQATCDLLYCEAGKYQLGSVCEECLAGTYKSNAGNEECTTCGAGTTTGTVTGATSSTQCDTVLCDSGSYRKPEQKSLCTACEIGRYQPSSGQTTCFTCPNNEITLTSGQSSLDACVPECQKGQEYNSTTKECQLCKTGNYKDSVGNIEMCQQCPTDKTTAGPGAKLASDCSQNKCPPGKYYVVEGEVIECYDCPIGTFSEEEMQPTCTECPNDGTTQAAGTDSESMCIDDCPAGNGYKTSTGICQKCKIGQYNAKQGKNGNTCKRCPPGKTNSQSGSTSCSFDAEPVTENQINVRFTVKVRVALDTCDDQGGITLIKNWFLELLRQLLLRMTNQRYNGRWKYCKGSKCDNLEYGSDETCNQLVFRKRAITHELTLNFVLMNISDYTTDTDEDVDIETEEIISMVLRLYGMDLIDNAREIFYQGFEENSVTVEDVCDLGQELLNSECSDCQAGSYGSSLGVCTVCPLNQYQAMTGQTECESCPDKSFTENTGTLSADMCIPICQAGNEFDNATKECSECAIGYYKVGEGNEQKCTACEARKTTESKGSTSINDCSKTVCLAGEYYEMVNGIVVCRPCDIGTYNPTEMASECQSCEGSTTTLGTGKKVATDCISECGPGNGYKISEEKCFPCAIGWYNDGTGADANRCKYCPDGQTTSSAGQTACVPETTPVPERRVTIVISLVVSVNIDSCSVNLNEVLLRTTIKFKSLFTGFRNSRYTENRSFCSRNCNNMKLRFPGNSAANSCKLKGAGRRKRATTHDLSLELVFENATESTMDTQTSANLPSEEVVQDILNNNKEQLPPGPDELAVAGVTAAQVNVICDPGQAPVNSVCVQCGTGRYGTNGETCVMCPADTYQDVEGQTSCKDCPIRTYYDATGATAPAACRSWCADNPTYCNNRGSCYNTGRRTASCSCYDDYEGSTCQSKKEPSSNLPAILGGAIGGGGALLIIILIVVGVFMRCSRDPAKERKHKRHYDPEYVQNGAYDGTYDNFRYPDSQVRPVAPYPSIGYPALGYRPDQSFEEGAYSRVYKSRPSIDGDDIGRPDEDTRFVWSA